MRRIESLILTIVLVLELCACGQDAVAAWQEQYDLGVRYLSEGNYEEAILAFTAAIEIDAKRPETYVGRGHAYIESGETEENMTKALWDYQTAVDLDETLLDAWLGIADMYFAFGDYDKAIEILKLAIEKVENPERLQSRLETLLSEIDKSNPFTSDPNILVYEMGVDLYLTEDDYHIIRTFGAGINNFRIYINFSKNAPLPIGYVNYNGTWGDGISRYVDWGQSSSLEEVENLMGREVSLDFVENHQTLSAQVDVGLGLIDDEMEKMPYLYVVGVDETGIADIGVVLRLELTAEIIEKIETIREYVYE